MTWKHSLDPTITSVVIEYKPRLIRNHIYNNHLEFYVRTNTQFILPLLMNDFFILFKFKSILKKNYLQESRHDITLKKSKLDNFKTINIEIILL